MPNDLRLAIRALVASPGFTAVALVVLTLGIGATTAIYSVVDAVALRGLPYSHAERLMFVEETDTTGKGFLSGYVAAPNFYDFRARQRSFEDLAAFQGTSLTIYQNGTPESLRSMMVSSSLMPMLRVSPRIGHMFSREQEVAGKNHVAVISDALWRSRFHSDEHILGRTFTVGTPEEVSAARGDAGVWEIIGVMAEGFEFPVGRLKPVELWTPFVPRDGEMPRGDGSSRNYNAQVLGRLKDGVTPEQALADMTGVAGAMKAEFPKWFRDRWVGMMPLHESIVGRTRGWMFLLLGSVSFVLLIACVNVANLMLARATARAHDMQVRAALGASRWQLARAVLAESLVLSTAGTVLGVAAAYWGVAIMRAALPPNLPRLSSVGIDLRVLAMAALAAIVTGILFGLLPALQLSRPALAGALREGGRSGTDGGRRQRARSLLLVAEVALATVLLVGAGLFVSSFVKLVHVDLGVDTDHVLTIGLYPKIDFSKARIDADMARAGAQTVEVLDRVRALPGAEAVGFASGSLPLTTGYSRTRLAVPGQPRSEDPDDAPDVKVISGDYFKAVSIPVLLGREFTSADSLPGAEPVIVINDIAADRFLKGQNPIGLTVESQGTRRIVGVVRAVRLGGPEAPLRPEVYMPFNPGRAFGGSVFVRTTRDPHQLSADVRAAVAGVLRDVVVDEPQSFNQLFDKLIVQRKFNMIVLALFGVLAIVIAAAGIYGVMAYVVEQRTREIGVRMALGARPRQVLGMILSRATIFMLMGVAIGLGAGWMLARFISTFLFQVEPHNVGVYAAASALLVAAGLVAALLPARRASRVDPIVVLK